MKIVNIGIVAHVDAGKTSLTERILFESKVISKLGRVDHGNTQTDTLDLERQRGITIKASVVSFFVDGFGDRLKVNLIDTPGHADFIAEVERSFSVLDGVVLVISAVEGIQAQTKFLMAILRQLAIPVILFINKIDRMGALAQPLVEQIKETLLPSVLPLYSVENPGVKEAAIVPNRLDASTHLAFVETAIDLLTQYDEQLLEAYLQEGGVTEAQLTASLIRQAQTAKVLPILFGSAMTGVGVPELLGAVATFFPTNDSTVEGALSAVVFKIERETSGEKAAYLRLYSGCLAVRAEVPVLRRGYNGEFALCGAESEERKGKTVASLSLRQTGAS